MYDIICYVQAGHLSEHSFLGNMKKQSLHMICWHGRSCTSCVHSSMSGSSAISGGFELASQFSKNYVIGSKDMSGV